MPCAVLESTLTDARFVAMPVDEFADSVLTVVEIAVKVELSSNCASIRVTKVLESEVESPYNDTSY